MPSPRALDTDTPIHRRRRDELVTVAIAVIADVGAPRATISRIARQAGVSRGVVSYHFRDRAALLDAVVAHVYDRAASELGGSVSGAPTPRDALIAFVSGSVDFYAEHAEEMTALSAIFAEPGADRAPRVEHRTEITDVMEILENGIDAGDFRVLDAPIVAATIRAALDASLHRLRLGSDVALERRELVALIDAATRR
ncbi:TetR/AcrR family transcriptional regulator [Gordonia soli]|uniref:Putative transcriptional regulator n=1 Tax=Gordonia soli NBRC 108243 TaxID=1223545 RepID=M0QNA2_9ACTN|nr:TetR/AcrR family transcriptional regulator [Gordonia soli]GAC69864.1 putative transcriptional regulator [Gordonia soli NBRC 108243]